MCPSVCLPSPGRTVMCVCVISYFVMMGVLTWYTTCLERGIFCTALNKDAAGIDPDDVWNASSSLKRCVGSSFCTPTLWLSVCMYVVPEWIRVSSVCLCIGSSLQKDSFSISYPPLVCFPYLLQVITWKQVSLMIFSSSSHTLPSHFSCYCLHIRLFVIIVPPHIPFPHFHPVIACK